MAFLLVSCASSSSTTVGLQKSLSPAIGTGFSILKLYIRLPGLWECDHIRGRVHCEVKGTWCVMDVVQQQSKSASQAFIASHNGKVEKSEFYLAP